MSRLEANKDPGSNEELTKAYAVAKELGWANPDGSVNNYAASMSSRPDLLVALGDITKSVLMSGELPLTVKAMVFYTIAERSKCEYCSVANSKALQMMGVPDDVIKSCANDPELADVPPSQRAIIKFGVTAAKYPQKLTEADFEALRDQGLSDGEISELIMMAGYAAMLDIWADAVALQLD